MAKQKENNDLQLSDKECRELYDKYVDSTMNQSLSF